MSASAVRVVLDRLGAYGRRRTGARAAAAARALARRKPFTATELVGDLGRAGIGRATVFRTLDLLVSTGALSRIHAIEHGERCVRYTPCAPAHHHHLACRACGRVEEITTDVLDAQLARVARDRGYRPLDHRLEIEGICAGCRARGR